MSEFTQGEWVYDEFSAIVKTVSNNSRPICIVIEEGEDEDDTDEDDTNGRLIAAAPEMYSLICVLLRCEALSDNLPNSCGYPALTKARSIINKVTGVKHE